MLLPAQAQKEDIAVAYIIDKEGQRKDGFIIVPKQIENEVKIKFSEVKKKNKYSILRSKDIKAYGFETTRYDSQNNAYIHWRHFSAYEFERPARIMASNTSLIEKLVEGYYDVSLFEYETGGKVDMPVTTRYLVFCDSIEVVQVEEDNFEEVANDIFGDYIALCSSIGKVKFRFGNFIRLIEDYNYWKEAQHDPNIYKMNPKIFDQ